MRILLDPTDGSHTHRSLVIPILVQELVSLPTPSGLLWILLHSVCLLRLPPSGAGDEHRQLAIVWIHRGNITGWIFLPPNLPNSYQLPLESEQEQRALRR